MNSTNAKKRRVCQICGSDRLSTLHPGVLVRPAVAELIQKKVGSWSEEGWICSEDLQKFRHEYVQSLLKAEKGELTAIEDEVLENLRQQEILSRNPDEELQSAATLGQRLADHIAAVGGSWTFITWFVVVLLAWIGINTTVLVARPFDPYPFIFLNLILSCLAAIQAPVIMMSQNRQEARDRLHAMRDYQVNLKAELEIRHLHQKLDHLLSHQWERLVAIQEIQMELIDEVRGRR
ncbi:MAG: hypothetical protein A2521_08345 [Deltaproteobacteria bacterium RIFOXYD12_FULL_57_12]|nr:MAG: hypothetical protein A2521_08345 [Deltaproteobacteria bacterium RIFOXYD12_FULL_57_12]